MILWCIRRFVAVGGREDRPSQFGEFVFVWFACRRWRSGCTCCNLSIFFHRLDIWFDALWVHETWCRSMRNTPVVVGFVNGFEVGVWVAVGPGRASVDVGRVGLGSYVVEGCVGSSCILRFCLFHC